MAAGRFIVGPYFPARDRDGVLQAGALLYVFENGTTTKATIYTDEGLSILSANPVVANASGQFPAVWGEAGTADVPVPYTVMVTASGGASLGNPSTFDDFYPSLNWENANITLAESAAIAADASADAAAVSAASALSSAETAALILSEIGTVAGILLDSDGNPFNPDSHPQTFAYDGSGNVSTITATDGVTTWVQTFTYGANGVATVSEWVVQ